MQSRLSSTSIINNLLFGASLLASCAESAKDHAINDANFIFPIDACVFSLLGIMGFLGMCKDILGYNSNSIDPPLAPNHDGAVIHPPRRINPLSK